MNWEAVGAIAELIGSLAVLATLVYLSFQIRFTREELKHSIRQNNEAANRELSLETIRNPDLREAILTASDGTSNSAKALQDQFDLSSEQTFILNNYLVSRMIYAQATIESDMDFFDEESRRRFDMRTRRLFSNGAGKIFFEAIEKNMPEALEVKYIRNLVDGT